MIKMNKIIIISTIALLLVGTITAYFGMRDEDFTFKVKTIDAYKLCKLDADKNKTEKKECKDIKNKDYLVDASPISIKYNNDTGVYQVKAQ